ncbi:MAG: hypothetical protein II997_07700 [Clostridia bacterium]|nr:hypothetical protein [Clostridia bacterium]
MATYTFPLGKEQGQVAFNLSEKCLTMKIIHRRETYEFEFLDGVLNDRFTSDWFAGVEFKHHATMYEGCAVTVKENGLEITGQPKRMETGEVMDQVTVTNRFTVLKEQAAITQETFFTVDGPLYDCSALIGRVEAKEQYFDMVGSEEADAFFAIKDLKRSNLAYPRELVFRGENRYLKVQGGLVCLCGKIIEGHIGGHNYNDTLSYYDEDNSVFTVFSFDEGAAPCLPVRNKKLNKQMLKVLSLISGNLTVDYVVKEHGLALWHQEKEQPLVAMQLQQVDTGKKRFIDTLSCWGNVSSSKKGNKTEFVLSNPEGISGVALKVTAKALTEQDRLEWDVMVVNDSSEYSLLWCTYPRLYWECDKSHDLFRPESGGSVAREFSKTDMHFNGSYPGGFYGTMAYMALYRTDEQKENGIYFGVHDASGGKKELQADSSQRGSVRLSCRCYAEDWGKAKNTNHLPGKMIWQNFAGDWFDATEIYREFVQQECFWTKRSIEDKQTPLWMQDVPFWVMDWVPQDSEDGEPIPTNLRTDSDEVKPEEWYENVICLQETFGVPIGYHVYNWHKIPFNNDYPHFLPAKDSFMKGLEELKKHDIRIMPYINALLWDTKDRGNSDFEFESIGRAGSVKTESGDPIILRFESRESDGKLVELTAMCPSYQKWRDKLVKLTTDMFEELGVDAIYLDQIAARIPHLCMDETHGHPLGGGSWWTREYNELLAELNSHRPEGKAFTSESNAEVFASQLDGFLSWAWVRCDNEVPAFMRIYSDVIKVLGRNTNGYMKHSDMHWKYHLAQSLLCGQQMGWVNADLINMPERLEFTKKLVQFRYAYREFFRHITVLRPPVVQAERAHKFVSDVGMGSAGMIMKPYICSAAMQNGKERMILLINIAKETMTDVMTFNPKEYNPGENFKVEGYGSVNCVSDGKMECAVEGEGYLCIKWEEE